MILTKGYFEGSILVSIPPKECWYVSGLKECKLKHKLGGTLTLQTKERPTLFYIYN
jgi:hypothetical protein